MDCGPSNPRQSFKRLVEWGRLERVYLTHYHEDRAGNAAYLLSACGIPVYGHALTRTVLSKRVTLKPYELYMWGPLKSVAVKEIDDHFDSENYRFEVIHTPGHSTDHVVYWEKTQGWLFSGDMYLGARIKYFRADEDLMQTVASLRKIASLDFDALLCGHNPQLNNPANQIRRKLAFFEGIIDSVSNLMASGAGDSEILARLVGKREYWPAKIITLGDVSYKNLIKSAIHGLMSSE